MPLEYPAMPPKYRLAFPTTGRQIKHRGTGLFLPFRSMLQPSSLRFHTIYHAVTFEHGIRAPAPVQETLPC